jgi:hypothetical protein
MIYINILLFIFTSTTYTFKFSIHFCPNFFLSFASLFRIIF